MLKIQIGRGELYGCLRLPFPSIISNWCIRKKNTSIPNSLYRVHNRQVLRAVSPGNVIVVGEGKRWDFFGGTPAFLSSSAVERVARKRVREVGRDERENERCKVRKERPRWDGSCWDVWETGPRYANPRLVVRGSTTKG